MFVESLLLSDGEPPPDTFTALTTGEAAFDATFTVTVMGGYPAYAFSTSLLVQEAIEQFHPSPDMEVKVRHAGTTSDTVTEPVVAPPPEFPVEIMYVAPICPGLNCPI
jgi:hypothetical protein